MRRTPTAIAMLALVCLTCGGVDNVTVTAEGQATIPEATPIEELLGSLSFAGFGSFDITQTQEFQNQGYSRDQIDSVKVRSFTLSINSPEGANFDFLDSIVFFAESEGLPRVEIASLDPVPEGAAELNLNINDVELADYAAAESMSITTEASGMRPPEETTVDAVVKLGVDVDVSGAAGCSVSP